MFTIFDGLYVRVLIIKTQMMKSNKLLNCSSNKATVSSQDLYHNYIYIYIYICFNFLMFYLYVIVLNTQAKTSKLKFGKA